jgi:copper chaperone CopZ
MNKDCHVTPVVVPEKEINENTARTAVLQVYGMGCRNCAMRITNTLLIQDGIYEAYINHELGSAQVKYDPAQINAAQIADWVFQSGAASGHEYFAYILQA